MKYLRDYDIIDLTIKFDISDSTHVEFQNILHATAWNPGSMKGVNSFLQSIGLYSYKRKVSAYDLAKIFFCYA